MQEITGPHVQLKSGVYVDLLDPKVDSVKINDIASGLSKICRFTGQCDHFYSVAQHSVLCSRHAAPQDKWHALMHDCAEAILGDVSTPLKKLLSEYQVIEHNVEKALFDRFQVSHKPVIKSLDLRALATEKRDLMPEGAPWAILAGHEPWPEKIMPWSPERAEGIFLEQVAELRPNSKVAA